MAHAERRNRDIDWPAVEHDYRAGALSLRRLAQKHDCAHSTIANFAARNGWVRREAGAEAAPTRRPLHPLLPALGIPVETTCHRD